MVTLASDGHSLIGKGGTGLGQIDADGNWIEKKQMTPVDVEGQEITPVKSSLITRFDWCISLKPKRSLRV